jgi:hypothetical protein
VNTLASTPHPPSWAYRVRRLQGSKTSCQALRRGTSRDVRRSAAGGADQPPDGEQRRLDCPPVWENGHVGTRTTAGVWADEQTAAVRDDPSARIALVERTYHGPFGEAPRHLPYRRAAMSFMRWQLRRGVLETPTSERPGSPWWRAVNERLLRDGCEAVALSGDLAGPPSSRTVDYWMSFADYPTARAWYRAHNASVVAGYLEHRDLAETENTAERFFMNVVLCRVLYAHALVAAPRISLGWLRPIAPVLGDPRVGMTGIFLQLSRVLPDEYPLTDDVGSYLSDELGFGRLLDFGVIVPRLQQLYEWSAHELAAPGLLDCIRDGAMTYAWPFEDRGVWHPKRSVTVRIARRALPSGRRGLR